MTKAQFIQKSFDEYLERGGNAQMPEDLLTAKATKYCMIMSTFYILHRVVHSVHPLIDIRSFLPFNRFLRVHRIKLQTKIGVC